MISAARRFCARKLPGPLAAAGLVAIIGGCGTSGSFRAPAAQPPTASPPLSPPTRTAGSSAIGVVRVSTKTVSGLGPVLVNAQGRTLYIFAPDKHSKVTCVSACASVWPPASLPTGEKPLAGGQAKESLLGSARSPEGGRVITYAGWPLYTYVGDAAPGQAHGQALNLNGGLWYVISPTGTVIRRRPSAVRLLRRLPSTRFALAGHALPPPTAAPIVLGL